MTIFTSFVFLVFFYTAIATPPANRKDSSNSGKNQTADDRYMYIHEILEGSECREHA